MNVHPARDPQKSLCILTGGSTPAAIPVVLFGYGEWSRKTWFPVLVQLARWDVIDLTVVERWILSEIPADLRFWEREGSLRYVAWEDLFEAGVAERWRVAYVVTSATTHHHVIHRLLEQASNLKMIICEKPCGEGIEQALDIFAACRRRGVALIVADHYLLRPGIQYLLAHPELLCSIGELMKIVALINESRDTGPQQGVITDLLVHLLDLLLILFPGAHFMPDEAYTALSLNSVDTGLETYTLVVGSLNLPDSSAVYCELEGGKQLGTDNKSVTLIGTTGRLQLDLINNTLTLALIGEKPKEVRLSWETHWSYARLILKSLSMS